MADLERHGLRGPVNTAIEESFDWDAKALAIHQKPSRRAELTFSREGKLLQSVSQFQGGLAQRSTYVYDKAGRLLETRLHNADGTGSPTKFEYDQYGEPISYGAKSVTYSTENGRKIKTEVLEIKMPNVEGTVGIAGGSANWSAFNATVASTFYDDKGRPAEIVMYDAEHIQISKIVRTYDEQGRVLSEENQNLGPRAFAGMRGANGEEMPELMTHVFAQAFSQGPTRITHKYDDAGRILERTQKMGLFGYDKTVSSYNEHGDLLKQQQYTTRQKNIPVGEDGNIITPPPAPERLESEFTFTYEYDSRGNWTLKKLPSTPHWESIEKRSISYY